MIFKSLILVLLLTVAGPDIADISYDQFDLHPSLGVVVDLGDRQVAYPVRMHTGAQCVFLVDRDPFLLTFRICYDNMLLTLGEPIMWRFRDKPWGHSMNTWED